MTEAVRSRRDRPAKPPLSRAWVLSATIDIVRREGLEKATMRRVAQALDTGPASLYVYVASTAELHAAVLDELTAAALDTAEDQPRPTRSDATTSPWTSRLESLLGAYSGVLLVYPGLARSALVLRPSGPNTIRLFDRILGLLLEGGVGTDRAAWGTDLLVQHVTADAAEHSSSARGDIESPTNDNGKQDAIVRAVRAADPKITPNVAAHADVLLAGPPTARSSWAIQALITGIASTPLPPTNP